MESSCRSSLLVLSGFLAGMVCSVAGFAFAASVDAPPKPTNHRYVVSLDEIRQNLVSGDEFVGNYSRIVTMSDGSQREIMLRSVERNGEQLVELRDRSQDGRIGITYMGRNGTTTNGTLMISVKESRTKPKKAR